MGNIYKQVKRIWFLYVWLSRFGKTLINEKSFKKEKEERDSLILELVNGKRR